MNEIRIQLLGEMAVWRDDLLLALPPSKKTRALLAYLVLTTRPHRRDRLCELFWDIPDDPRGALRWSLSKLRSVVNSDDQERLAADRERVAWEATDVEVDIVQVNQALEAGTSSHAELTAYAQLLRDPLMDGLDLPNQSLFQQWLTTERLEAEQLAIQVAQQLCQHEQTTPREAVEHASRWLELQPLEANACSALVRALRAAGHDDDAKTMEYELRQRLSEAGITWFEEPPPPASSQSSQPPPPETPNEPTQPVRSPKRQLLARQKIQFCSAADGTRIAYASVGDGPPLVKAANWLNHLELDWDAPIWSPLFQQLARDFELIRYDERGNGLSDWEVDEITPEVFTTDLETVVDAAELTKFPLLGISQGASVSIDYAVRHPERVTHLILFGGYAAGWRIDADDAQIQEREAIMTLTATGWGRDNPAYRQIFSSTFMPSATTDELHWFNEFQRQTTSPENAVRFLSAFGDIDVRDKLSQVSVPTLVIHSRGDKRIPLDSARELAYEIPNAEFLSLDSDNHLLLGREPASDVFVSAVKEFVR